MAKKKKFDVAVFLENTILCEKGFYVKGVSLCLVEEKNYEMVLDALAVHTDHCGRCQWLIDVFAQFFALKKEERKVFKKWILKMQERDISSGI